MIWTDCVKEFEDIIMRKDEFLSMIPDEYEDIRDRLKQVPSIKHLDLWHDQISFLDEEHEFPTPAIFFEFNTLGITDNGMLTQRIITQIDFHIYYETFTDTYAGAIMQEDAYNFLDLITLYGMMFHGRSGQCFGTMRRTGIQREDSGSAGNLYRISFETELSDYSAVELSVLTEMLNKNIAIEDAKNDNSETNVDNLFSL